MPDDLTAAKPGTLPAAARRSRPIALYLFVLALVALVPAFVFSAILLQRNNEAQARVVETLVTGTARSIVQAIEREIASNITTLRVLSTAPALLAGDYQSFHSRVRLALEGTGSFVYVQDANQHSLMSTRVEYGAPLPDRSSDPATGERALASRNVVVSDVLFSTQTQRWVFNIVMPVFAREQAPLLLGYNRWAGDLSGALLSNALPEGWNVALIDTKGYVIAASPGSANPGDRFELADAPAAATSDDWTDIKTPQDDYLAVVRRSPLTDWTLFAWAPRALITQPLSTAFWSLLVGGILLAAVVVLIIYWVSLRIGRSVHGLEDDAKLLGAGEAVPARDYPISEIATVSDSLAEASARRKAAETEVRLLMRELAHRSKNQLAVIAAMAKQSAKGATSVEDFVASFERRIHSLARSIDLLLAYGIAGVDLRDVLVRQIDPLCPVESGRVTLSGPAFKLSTQSAQILGMAAHELASNASTYGAFSVDEGRLEVSWTVGDDHLQLVWREHNTPVGTRSPSRRGFGTTVLETMVGRSLNADVTHTFHDDGIEWTFAIPLAALALGDETAAGGAAASTQQAAAAPEK